MGLILFIHSSLDGHLGSFYLFAIVTSTAMNICVQGFVWMWIFSSQTNTYWLLSYVVIVFNFLENC